MYSNLCPLSTFTSTVVWFRSTVRLALYFLLSVKTRMQAAGGMSTLSTAKEIYSAEGIRGLYRGGLPLVLGGAL